MHKYDPNFNTAMESASLWTCQLIIKAHHRLHFIVFHFVTKLSLSMCTLWCVLLFYCLPLLLCLTTQSTYQLIPTPTAILYRTF
jgi:hypothetical protein